MSLWYYVPNVFKSNDWLIDEVLDGLEDQEYMIGDRIAETEYEEKLLRAKIENELKRTESELTSTRSATNLENVISLSGSLRTVRKIKLIYSESLQMLKERKASIIEYRANLTVSDSQVAIDKAMDDISKHISSKWLKERFDKGKQARVKMTDNMKLVKQAIETAPMTEEEKEKHFRDCSSQVASIAKQMGRDDIVTQLNKIENKNGQFTSVSEIEAAFSSVLDTA